MFYSGSAKVSNLDKPYDRLDERKSCSSYNFCTQGRATYYQKYLSTIIVEIYMKKIAPINAIVC